LNSEPEPGPQHKAQPCKRRQARLWHGKLLADFLEGVACHLQANPPNRGATMVRAAAGCCLWWWRGWRRLWRGTQLGVVSSYLQSVLEARGVECSGMAFVELRHLPGQCNVKTQLVACLLERLTMHSLCRMAGLQTIERARKRHSSPSPQILNPTSSESVPETLNLETRNPQPHPPPHRDRPGARFRRPRRPRS
jgi:hypothetical protein